MVKKWRYILVMAFVVFAIVSSNCISGGQDGTINNSETRPIVSPSIPYSNDDSPFAI